MINYIMIGTNDLDASIAFYDVLLIEMGATRAYVAEQSAGWGWGVGTPMFIVTKPYDKQLATVGNGSMVAFDVDTPAKVDALHARVLALGGSNEGSPGLRGANMYAAYWRDAAGNKFNFICYTPTASAGT